MISAKRSRLVPAAGEAEEREQRLEDVVQVEVDAQRRADVVRFLAVANALQVVQDEGREDADHQHRDRDEQRARLQEDVGDDRRPAA